MKTPTKPFLVEPFGVADRPDSRSGVRMACHEFGTLADAAGFVASRGDALGHAFVCRRIDPGAYRAILAVSGDGSDVRDLGSSGHYLIWEGATR